VNQKKIDKAVRTLLSQNTRVGSTTISNTAIFQAIVAEHEKQLRAEFLRGYELGLAAHQAALDNAPAPLTAEEALEIHCPHLLTNK